MVARLTNLDWFVRKGGKQEQRQRELAALAAGFDRIPVKIAGEDQFASLLGLDRSSTWGDEAWRQVLECSPPLHGDLRALEDSSPFVRWLALRVLPYPAFLWSLEYVAAHLRIEPDSLRGVIEAGNSELAVRLKGVRFNGVFDELLGNRWWKAGVERVLWDLTNGESFSGSRINQAIEAASEAHVKLRREYVVPIVDKDFHQTDTLAPVDDAVRLQLDDWPAFASPPWILTESLNETPSLDQYVASDDRGRYAAST